MKLIYLNRWGIVFHAILATVTEDEDRVLGSRVCTTLQEAWRLIEAWQLQHGIAAQDIRDNSRLDLNELFAQSSQEPVARHLVHLKVFSRKSRLLSSCSHVVFF